MDSFWIYIVLALVFMIAVIFVAPRLMDYLDHRQAEKFKRESREDARASRKQF